MRNKKGFTLIELLAVIAILSILLIIAIPGVLKMFDNAKKNTFIDQAESIYNTAQKQFMADQLEGGGEVTYCYTEGSEDTGICSDTTYTTQSTCESNSETWYPRLELSGNKDTQYMIEFDASGKVKNFVVSDKSYGIGLIHETDIDINDVKDASLEDGLLPVPCVINSGSDVTPE